MERKVAVVEILKTSAGSVPPRVALALSLFIYGVFLIMPLQGWQRSPSKEWSLKLGGSDLSRPSESFCVLLLLYLLFGYSFFLWRLFLSSFVFRLPMSSICVFLCLSYCFSEHLTLISCAGFGCFSRPIKGPGGYIIQLFGQLLISVLQTYLVVAGHTGVGVFPQSSKKSNIHLSISQVPELQEVKVAIERS